jgi:hypothetical protein
VKRTFIALTLVELGMIAALFVWNGGKLDTSSVYGATADPWIRLQRLRLDGEPAIVYLERDWEKRDQRRIKFRLKYVYDAVQVHEQTTLKYKEFQVAMEVNCGTGRTRHLLTTLYGPQGGALMQFADYPIEEGSRDAFGLAVCARAT